MALLKITVDLVSKLERYLSSQIAKPLLLGDTLVVPVV